MFSLSLFSAPDVMENDGIISGYFYSLYAPGYHSLLYQETPISFNSSILTPSYTSVGHSFYVTNPRNQTEEADIPPARIADLRVVKIDAVEQKATIEFTEPGNDFMDNGGIEHEIVGKNICIYFQPPLCISFTVAALLTMLHLSVMTSNTVTGLGKGPDLLSRSPS